MSVLSWEINPFLEELEYFYSLNYMYIHPNPDINYPSRLRKKDGNV